MLPLTVQTRSESVESGVAGARSSMMSPGLMATGAAKVKVADWAPAAQTTEPLAVPLTVREQVAEAVAATLLCAWLPVSPAGSVKAREAIQMPRESEAVGMPAKAPARR